MFKASRVLNSGIVWKKTKWSRTRKDNALKQRNRMNNVDAELRKPYFSVTPASNAAAEPTPISFQQIMAAAYANTHQLHAQQTSVVREELEKRKL